MSTQRTEYRVRWKREGRRQSTVIYQRWDSAYRKAHGILGLEAVKGETSFHAMPNLELAPVIESRPVGIWSPCEQQISEAPDQVKRSMVEWAEYTDPKSPEEIHDFAF